jgi:Helix-turn-helix domain
MSSKEFTARVFAYIKQVNRDKELPSAAVRVALAIANRWNEESGEAHPSLQTIALEGGLGEGTVRRMLPVLVERGHLAVQWGSRGSKHPNHYWPLDESANGGAIQNANGGAIAEKAKAPSEREKAPFPPKKAPTGALNTQNTQNTLEHTKGSASTARMDRGDVTETENTSDDASLNPAFDTADAATNSEPVVSPVPRAEARTEPIAAQNPKPSRVKSEKNIGIPANANGANADADAERAAVFGRGREVLGAGSDALVARLLDAERALDALGAAERVLDALNAAANEDDPHTHIENEIALALQLQAANQ